MYQHSTYITFNASTSTSDKMKCTLSGYLKPLALGTYNFGTCAVVSDLRGECGFQRQLWVLVDERREGLWLDGWLSWTLLANCSTYESSVRGHVDTRLGWLLWV